MTLQLSERVQRIKPSPTLAVAARASRLKAEGKNIINLSVGEPDFDTPEYIKEGAIHAIRDGFTKYTAVDGIASLKQAIVKKFSTENHLHYEPAQILVSCGAKQGIFNLMQALLNTGDEVIIPTPYWVSYPDIVLLADATPVLISSNFTQHFKITPEQLEAAITPKTRLFILNSPSNPSGKAYSAEELKALAAVLIRHPQITILSDDIYEHIVWKALPFTNILNVCPELYNRTVVFNGVSKAYAMTGWRIGYAAGPAPFIKAMTNIQSQSTSNPNSIAQVAAQVALEGDQSCVKTMVKAYQERHQLLFDGFSAIPGVNIHPSDGTFYSFIHIQNIINQLPHIHSDIDFAELLLNDAGLAVIPGSAFGDPECIRLSFATSIEDLKQALIRFKKIVMAIN
ncbi:MAG: pyridoxal phosphate-dependent aminotransferase [Gammaproteobacteria bacterium]